MIWNPVLQGTGVVFMVILRGFFRIKISYRITFNVALLLNSMASVREAFPAPPWAISAMLRILSVG